MEQCFYWRNTNEFRQYEKKEYIDECLSKGDDWMIAAMIDGSSGYHSVRSCEITLDRYRSGVVEDWSERCISCFDCNLIDMLFNDFKSFARNEAEDSESIAKNLAFVRATRSLSDEAQISMTLRYPTMGI